MILDARRGDRFYQCYDAKTCRMVKYVVWVDDGAAQWGGYVAEGSNPTDITTRQEERITIYLDRKLVIFNEVEDCEIESVSTGCCVNA